MKAGDPTRKQAFRAALGDADLKALQAIQAALMTGVLLFGLVVVLLAIRPQSIGAALPTPAATLTLLSLVHGVMALGAWAAAFLLHGALLRSASAGAGAPAGAESLAALRKATLVRLALLEGPALFGLVICLLAALGGTLRETPVYWLNAASALAFLAFAALSFPTRERVEASLAEHFGR